MSIIARRYATPATPPRLVVSAGGTPAPAAPAPILCLRCGPPAPTRPGLVTFAWGRTVSPASRRG